MRDSFRRNLQFTRLGVQIGARFAAHQLRNVFRSEAHQSTSRQEFYSQQAAILATQLGQLKGGAMKAGQLLALFGEYFLPAPVVAELRGIQNLSQPLPWSRMAPVLENALGRKGVSELEIDEVPVGAASLGQVHRARRRQDGMKLCLKIQYPGVGESIDSDMRLLARLVGMSRVAPRGLDLTPMFHEIREMLVQELDYRRELHFTLEYAHRLSNDPRFIVPKVLPEYSRANVLALSYESGSGFHQSGVASLSKPKRNRLATALLDLFLTELFDWRMVQTDPNFGNYLFTRNERDEYVIVLLDFGATRVFSSEFVDAYGAVVRGALFRDLHQIVSGASDLGILSESFPRSVHEGFAQMCELIVEPFEDPGALSASKDLWNPGGEYRWGMSDLPERVGRAAALSMLTIHYRLPPRELVFLHRRLAGLFIMLRMLDAEFNGRAQLMTALECGERGASRKRGVDGR